MANNCVSMDVMDKALLWTADVFDESTRAQVRDMIENNPAELTDAFYKDLEFGTGGLRGIMGAGTNRMNKYTVAMATQGLANYIKKSFNKLKQIKIVIAYDSRLNNTAFADISADVLSANGIMVYLFDDIRPTPELSFAIRLLGCQSGIVITASHNPKEYNGYKAYWNDGAQLISPHDTLVIEEVRKIKDISMVRMERNNVLVKLIGEDIDKQYIDYLKSLSLSPEIISKHKELKIVYTPLHGSGVKLVPASLKGFGFANIITIEEQDISDGNFPTVKSPNPEEKAALGMAIEKAKQTGASLVLATDPDADRVGVAIRDNAGNYILLNGNQTASILTHYLLTLWKEKGKLTGNEYIVKTIVTTELLREIAKNFSVEIFDVLTGFKYIAGIIRDLEGKKKFIGGGEESYGYLVGDGVRDKDAVISCCIIAEAAAWAAESGKTLYDILMDIYKEYGLFKESLLSLERKGKSGEEEIHQMMIAFRQSPPEEINQKKVIRIFDYLTQSETDLQNNSKTEIHLPESDVLQFLLEDGSKITVRPSGTEPKIKFYFSVRGEHTGDLQESLHLLDKKINDIINSLHLN